MSLASLPHKIPFNLGGLVRPGEVVAYGFTGVLPKKLPFTLSALVPQEEIPYGSLGWELICRAHDDFQTELLRTTDFTSLTFSRELSALGAASFALNLDHPLFQQTLANGSSVEDLFDYENLWEIRFDGKIRFQVLGTAVVDSQINDNEQRTATVSGTGIGKVLDWATVYPFGFPDNIVTKLETLKDPMSGEFLNTEIWEDTRMSNFITYTSSSAKQEAVRDVETYTAEKEQVDQAVAAANVDYNAEKAAYAAVMKDKTSTAAEKKEATRQLNAALVRRNVVGVQQVKNAERLAWANARSAFYGSFLSTDTEGHLKVSVGSADTATVWSGKYDFNSSGISAGIEIAASSADSDGQAHTILKVFYSEASNYARIYSARINGNLRLVAEVANNNLVVNEDWEYVQTEQKYWRIREDNGEVVFDTSPNNTTWTERYRHEYTWPSAPVQVSFGVEVIGKPGISFPLSAYMFALNETTLPGVEPAMVLFRELLESAQSRGTIPYVTLGYSDTADSRGLEWIGEPVIDIAEGTKLGIALQSLAEIQQADWLMDNDFNLKIYQRTKEDETIPPVYFTKEDVVFHETGSQISKERNRSRAEVANIIVGKNASGQYAYVQDETSIDKFQRREAFITAGNATDLENLALVLDSSLESLKDETTSWRLTVAADQPGRRVFEDYDVGDWIAIENIDSSNNVTVAQWRVIGIAVQITSDAITTVELTLQSRMQLLAERLKSQVERMGSASTPGGTTLGSAISAATLIQQATLAGLKDVVIPNPAEGDVLTYTNGFWTPVAPGDKTIPETPVITTVFSNVYYPADGVSVRAQAEISWLLPSNTDGSVITDGHHYEIRYRPDVSADYPATWQEAAQYDWEEVYTWGQPTIPPITNSGWQVLYVGWDENSTVIQELSPGVNYEIQIRAVDSSTPQHFSEWSEVYVFSANRDTIAPPMPAPPVIASSLLGIQVQHFLGQFAGGEFNLPPDMAYLEVHAGGPSFYPDDSTRIGKIVADQGMIRSGTPVIQTFNLESTENIWVRVIAVDKAGNRSGPSPAVTSTINLIDDAHISDLTASKITAGTITSSIILGGVIKTAESGARAEMNFEGFRIFSEDDDSTVSLLGNPSIEGNFLLIKDLEDPTITLAGIDGTGRGSFQDISVTNDITIGGENLMADVITPRSKGVVAIGVYDGDPVTGAGPGLARGFLEISFVAEESRSYMIYAVTEFESTSTTNERMVMGLYDFGEDQPVLPLPVGIERLQQSVSSLVGGAGVNSAAQVVYAGTFTPGLHRILWTFAGQLGNCTVNASTGTSVPSVSLLWVEDVGIPLSDTVIINDGGVDAQGAVVTPNKPAPAKPKTEYTKTYSCTWSGTYRSNGDYSSSHGSTMVQGDSGSDSWLNDARSLCGFDSAAIRRDLSGATIKSCYITLYANHWYWNDGGTARIGTHDYASRPSSWSGGRVDEQRVSSSNWPKPGKRKVSLGTTIGNEFKSGASKGIAIGPTSGSKTQYGRFNGNGQSSEPVLTITYVK
jgi:hypothetical protein